MGVSSWLATFLDERMLAMRAVAIAVAAAQPDELAQKTGDEVFEELGGRYLVRYLLPSQVGLFGSGSSAGHCVTPTAYAPEEAVAFLALPEAKDPRPFALIDTRLIPAIRGPQRVRGAPGLQYFLPGGFPGDAVVIPGTGRVGWEMQVR